MNTTRFSSMTMRRWLLLLLAVTLVPMLAVQAGVIYACVHDLSMSLLKSLLLAGGIVFLAALGSLGVALLVNHRIIHGLRSLQEHAMALGRGELRQLPEDLKIVELNQLAEAFARMAAQLHERTLSVEKAAQDLRKSNKDLEQFAYVASHDLQEPLRLVTGYLQLISRRYRSHLDKDADEFIDFAVNGAHRMQQLINDLLSYSRVTTRGGEFAPTDSGKALERALANLRTQIEESAAVVTRGEMPIVKADGGQLAQVFQNLISNAIKFRGQSRPEIRVDAHLEDKRWRFTVSDNGIGIEPQYSERIFVIFQRLHGRDRYPGTGIGLAICKRIVERHGGDIWVESTPGKGSSFNFTVAAY